MSPLPSKLLPLKVYFEPASTLTTSSASGILTTGSFSIPETTIDV